MLKKRFNDDEKFGLTEEETKRAEKYLRKHKTAGAIPDSDSMPLYEMYMIGCSFNEIHQEYPQYPVEKIILTAALRGWTKDRERMNSSLRERIRSKVAKSLLEQVDALTTTLAVFNVEYLEKMKKYISDPKHNPPPNFRIKNIKDYKEIMEALSKMVASSANAQIKNPNIFDTLEDKKKPALKAVPKELESADVIEGQLSESES
jgi:hypothetical protein